MGQSLLSKPAILANLDKGIIIDPFNPDQLRSTSYDVSMGEWYCTRKHDTAHQVLNPYDPTTITDRYNKPQRAQMASNHPLYNPRIWTGIDPDDLVIVFIPHEPVLTHTVEFIG